jgi:hypothetical protein
MHIIMLMDFGMFLKFDSNVLSHVWPPNKAFKWKFVDCVNLLKNMEKHGN